MQSIRRFLHCNLRLLRIGLRILLPLLTVFALALAPMAVVAQTPGSLWIPPYPPRDVPVSPADGRAVEVTDHSPFPLIIDTDPGVDDAVALAWLLSVLDPVSIDPVTNEKHVNILAIVTVAGNTTVDNATKNVFKILQQVGKKVPVVKGAKKPLDEKLSSLGYTVHGPNGLWGTPDATSGKVQSVKARNLYCSTGKHNPGATILALGPLTNIAEAIHSCPRHMRKYKRIVIVGGAKFGGNTTPVAEFNFWQDPEAAQIVFESGMNIDLVPTETFSQLSFTEEELLGGAITFDTSQGFPVPIFPSCQTISSGIFRNSELPVFDFLAEPVCMYALTQFFAQLASPVRVGNLPDLVGAIYTLNGPAPVTPPNALVEVVERPDSVRGQSIIGSNAGELLAMATSDKEFDALAESTQTGVLDPNFQAQLFAILSKIKLNANVVWLVDAATMKADFQTALDQVVTIFQSEPVDEEPLLLPEKLFLPSVGVD